jgi:molybdopterin-guanine dinucleotide biosynthesis protein A
VGAGLTPQVRGAILAGGQATRLGRVPKGLLVVNGRRMIDAVHSALTPACDDIVVCSSHPDAAQWLPSVRVVPDLVTDAGSAAGVHAALRQLAAPVVVVAWDMPFVTAALVALLCERGARGGTEHDAVVIAGRTAGTYEPLCAWYLPPMADAIERAWAQSERSLQVALRDLRLTVIERDELRGLGGADQLLRNVNTPADLAAAQEIAP